MQVRLALLLGSLVATATPAAGHFPSIPGVGGLGGLPNISGIGMNNAAGVLGYCTKNKVLGSSTGAPSVLKSLEKKPGVTSSKEFAAGQAGQILTGKGKGFSLNSAAAPLKSQGCEMVLKQARHFL